MSMSRDPMDANNLMRCISIKAVKNDCISVDSDGDNKKYVSFVPSEKMIVMKNCSFPSIEMSKCIDKMVNGHVSNLSDVKMNGDIRNAEDLVTVRGIGNQVFIDNGSRFADLNFDRKERRLPTAERTAVAVPQINISNLSNDIGVIQKGTLVNDSHSIPHRYKGNNMPVRLGVVPNAVAVGNSASISHCDSISSVRIEVNASKNQVLMQGSSSTTRVNSNSLKKKSTIRVAPKAIPSKINQVPTTPTVKNMHDGKYEIGNKLERLSLSLSKFPRIKPANVKTFAKSVTRSKGGKRKRAKYPKQATKKANSNMLNKSQRLKIGDSTVFTGSSATNTPKSDVALTNSSEPSVSNADFGVKISTPNIANITQEKSNSRQFAVADKSSELGDKLSSQTSLISFQTVDISDKALSSGKLRLMRYAYVCEICLKSLEKVNLYAHVKREHGKVICLRDDCLRIFGSEKEFYFHSIFDHKTKWGKVDNMESLADKYRMICCECGDYFSDSSTHECSKTRDNSSASQSTTSDDGDDTFNVQDLLALNVLSMEEMKKIILGNPEEQFVLTDHRTSSNLAGGESCRIYDTSELSSFSKNETSKTSSDASLLNVRENLATCPFDIYEYSDLIGDGNTTHCKMSSLRVLETPGLNLSDDDRIARDIKMKRVRSVFPVCDVNRKSIGFNGAVLVEPVSNHICDNRIVRERSAKSIEDVVSPDELRCMNEHENKSLKGTSSIKDVVVSNEIRIGTCIERLERNFDNSASVSDLSPTSESVKLSKAKSSADSCSEVYESGDESCNGINTIVPDPLDETNRQNVQNLSESSKSDDVSLPSTDKENALVALRDHSICTETSIIPPLDEIIAGKSSETEWNNNVDESSITSANSHKETLSLPHYTKCNVTEVLLSSSDEDALPSFVSSTGVSYAKSIMPVSPQDLDIVAEYLSNELNPNQVSLQLSNTNSVTSDKCSDSSSIADNIPSHYLSDIQSKVSPIESSNIGVIPPANDFSNPLSIEKTDFSNPLSIEKTDFSNPLSIEKTDCSNPLSIEKTSNTDIIPHINDAQEDSQLDNLFDMDNIPPSNNAHNFSPLDHTSNKNVILPASDAKYFSPLDISSDKDIIPAASEARNASPIDISSDNDIIPPASGAQNSSPLDISLNEDTTTPANDSKASQPAETSTSPPHISSDKNIISVEFKATEIPESSSLVKVSKSISSLGLIYDINTVPISPSVENTEGVRSVPSSTMEQKDFLGSDSVLAKASPSSDRLNSIGISSPNDSHSEHSSFDIDLGAQTLPDLYDQTDVIPQFPFIETERSCPDEMRPSPAMAVNFDNTLDATNVRIVIKECVKTSSTSCAYCNNALLIAVNGKELISHIVGTHIYTIVKNDSSLGIADKLMQHVRELENVHVNVESIDSVELKMSGATKQVYACFQCRYRCNTLSELRDHLRKLHKLKKIAHSCPMCETVFETYAEVLCHMCPGNSIIEPFSLRFRCLFCEITGITSAFRLLVHLRLKHSCCNICLERCSDQNTLSNHIALKHKIEHACLKCRVTYNNKLDMTKHLFWKHGSESVCCKKCLKKKWSHQYHFCQPPTNFNCGECDQLLPNSVALMVHKRLHSNDLRHSCKDCDCKFISKKILIKHELDMHTSQTLKADKTQPNCQQSTECPNLNEISVAKEVINSSKKRKECKAHYIPPLNLSSDSDSESDENTDSKNSFPKLDSQSAVLSNDLKVISGEPRICNSKATYDRVDTSSRVNTSPTSLKCDINTLNSSDLILCGPNQVDSALDACSDISTSGKYASVCKNKINAETNSGADSTKKLHKLWKVSHQKVDSNSSHNNASMETSNKHIPSTKSTSSNRRRCQKYSRKFKNPKLDSPSAKNNSPRKKLDNSMVIDNIWESISICVEESEKQKTIDMYRQISEEHSYCIPEVIFHSYEEVESDSNPVAEFDPCIGTEASLEMVESLSADFFRSKSADSASESSSSSCCSDSNCSGCSGSNSDSEDGIRRNERKMRAIVPANGNVILPQVYNDSDLDTDVTDSDEEFYDAEPVILHRNSRQNILPLATFNNKSANKKKKIVVKWSANNSNKIRAPPTKVEIDILAKESVAEMTLINEAPSSERVRNGNGSCLTLVANEKETKNVGDSGGMTEQTESKSANVPKKPKVNPTKKYSVVITKGPENENRMKQKSTEAANRSMETFVECNKSAVMKIKETATIGPPIVNHNSKEAEPEAKQSPSGSRLKRKRVPKVFADFEMSELSKIPSKKPKTNEFPKFETTLELSESATTLKKHFDILLPKITPKKIKILSSILTPKDNPNMKSSEIDAFNESSENINCPSPEKSKSGLAPFVDQTAKPNKVIIRKVIRPDSRRTYSKAPQATPRATTDQELDTAKSLIELSRQPIPIDTRPFTINIPVTTTTTSVYDFNEEDEPSSSNEENTANIFDPAEYTRVTRCYSDKAEKLYCFCQKPYNEADEMIACDESGCLIEWFHFTCLRIDQVPEGKWYCPECSAKRKYLR